MQLERNKSVDVYIYLPLQKTAEHKAQFQKEDLHGKAIINDIQKMEKEKVIDGLRRMGVLTQEEDANFIYLGDKTISETQIAVPSKNFERMTMRYDQRQ